MLLVAMSAVASPVRPISAFALSADWRSANTMLRGLPYYVVHAVAIRSVIECYSLFSVLSVTMGALV